MKHRWQFAGVVAALGLSFLSAQSAWAAGPAQGPHEPLSLSALLPEGVEALIAAAPPEIAAHALISIAGRTADMGTRGRVFLFEEAFSRAEAAREAMPRHLLPGHSVDNLAGMTDAAAEEGLDRLTLQCRAVRAIAKLDIERALKLLSAIAAPKITPLSCKDFAIPSAAVYYSTLGELYSVAAAAGRSRESGEVLQMLSASALAAGSALEVAGLFEVLPGAGIPFGDLVAILNGVAGSLETMPADARTMPAAMPWLQMGLLKIAQTTGRQGVDVKRVVSGLHSAARKALDEPQCKGLGEGNTSAREIVEPFNRLLAVYGKVLGDESAKSMKLEWPGSGRSRELAEPVLEEFWQSEAARHRQRLARELKAPGRDAVNPAQAAQVVEEIAQWTAGKGESAAEVFHQSSILLYDLMKHPALADVRPVIAAKLCGQLSSSEVRWSHPGEWYVHAKRTLAALRPEGGAGRAAAGCETPQLELVRMVEEQRWAVKGR